ncbi:fungal-specific transcription factor domain-containing protein [Aspergillus venezuelensis]
MNNGGSRSILHTNQRAPNIEEGLKRMETNQSDKIRSDTISGTVFNVWPTLLCRLRKIALACNRCRGRKIRCDGAQPACSSCSQRNVVCVYDSKNPRKRQDNEYLRRLYNTPSHEYLPSHAPENPAQTAKEANYDYITCRSVSPESSSLSQKRITAMGLTTDRPVSRAIDQNEFFGDSSVASFLEQIKGSSGSHQIHSNRHDESHINSMSFPGFAEKINTNVQGFEMPPRPLVEHLLGCYFNKIHSLYPFVHRPSFMRAYNAMWAAEPEAFVDPPHPRIGLGDPSVSRSTFLCALNIILALGTQFSNLDSLTRDGAAEMFFHRCQQSLNLISLDTGDLALVQTLLLTSQYLQGGESPSRCWNIIGLACRIAQSLGMHSLQADRNRSALEVQMRRRVWHECIMLDLASSMMLGRPPMTHASAVPLPQAIDDQALDHSLPFPKEPHQALSQTEFYPWEDTTKEGQREEIKFANNQLQRLLDLDGELLDFKSSLPDHLNWESAQRLAPLTGPFSRESSLLKARFLHLRILLLRPSLVRFCNDCRSPATVSAEVPSKSSGRILWDINISCSKSCVEAAIELAHVMNDISMTDLTSVWWYSLFYTFTAGVVLILARTCSGIESTFTNQSLDYAWQSCIHSLESIRSCNSSVKPCSDSLQRTLTQVMQDHGRDTLTSSQAASQVAPQTTTLHADQAPSSSVAYVPNLAQIPATGEPTLGDQSSLQTSEYGTLSYIMGQQDAAGSLFDMMWDESWLTAPTFF